MPSDESLIPPEHLTIERLAEIFSEAGFPNKVQPGTNRMVFNVTPATVASVPSIVTMVRTESHKLLGPMLQASASARVKPADSYVEDGRWELLNWMNQWEWSLQFFLCGSVSETHGSCGDDDSPDVINLRSQLLIGAGVARSQGFVELAQIGANARTASLVHFGAASDLADRLLGAGVVSHGIL